MKSYFKERRNRTKIRQGSSLGPLLWNTYQNDLFYIERESRQLEYADNHQLHYAYEDSKEVADVTARDGKQTFCWYTQNFLEGNLGKYQAMTISKGTHDQELNIEVNACKIKSMENWFY